MVLYNGIDITPILTALAWPPGPPSLCPRLCSFPFKSVSMPPAALPAVAATPVPLAGTDDVRASHYLMPSGNRHTPGGCRHACCFAVLAGEVAHVEQRAEDEWPTGCMQEVVCQNPDSSDYIHSDLIPKTCSCCCSTDTHIPTNKFPGPPMAPWTPNSGRVCTSQFRQLYLLLCIVSPAGWWAAATPRPPSLWPLPAPPAVAMCHWLAG